MEEKKKKRGRKVRDEKREEEEKVETLFDERSEDNFLALPTSRSFGRGRCYKVSPLGSPGPTTGRVPSPKKRSSRLSGRPKFSRRSALAPGGAAPTRPDPVLASRRPPPGRGEILLFCGGFLTLPLSFSFSPQEASFGTVSSSWPRQEARGPRREGTSGSDASLPHCSLGWRASTSAHGGFVAAVFPFLRQILKK